MHTRTLTDAEIRELYEIASIDRFMQHMTRRLAEIAAGMPSSR